MTTTTATTPSIAVIFGRAAAAEWTRIITLRSTWWSLAAAVGLMLFMGAAAGSDFSGDPTPVWFAGEFAIVPGQFAFLLIVLLAVTADYSTGAIRSSLQWVPHRGVLQLARTLVPVAATTAAAVVVTAATDLMAWAWMGDDAVVVAADIARSLGTVAIVVAAGGLLTVGLATFLRSTAGTLTTIFLLLLVLPAMLPGFGIAWLTAIAERLPGWATVSLLDAMEIASSPGSVAHVLVIWIGLATVAGAWSLLRRDAT